MTKHDKEKYIFSWADQCPEYHDEGRGTTTFNPVGQNMYIAWSSSLNEDWSALYKDAVDSWYDEVRFSKVVTSWLSKNDSN